MSVPDVDLCQIPAGAPPPGVTPNFVNPPTLAPALMSVMGVTVLWALIFTGARMYNNIRKLTWSDYCVFFALLIAIATLGIETQQLRTARHIWDVPACTFDADFAIGVFVPAFLFQLGAFFAKTSIFLLFLQLFTIQKSVRIAIWVGQAFNFLIYGVGIAVATYYEVPHIGETWENTLDGRALVPVRWWQLQSGLIILLDIYIFVLPLPVLATLRLPRGRKLALTGVFSVALMGIGASIASLAQRILIVDSNDPTWISTILSLCSAVELNISIIVSSAPAFANYTRHHLSHVGDSAFMISLLRITGLSRYGPGSTRGSFKNRSRSKLDRAGSGSDRDVEGGMGSQSELNKQEGNHKNHKYYEMELNDTWMVKTGHTGAATTTVDVEVDANGGGGGAGGAGGAGAGSREGGLRDASGNIAGQRGEGAIVRTVAFDQRSDKTAAN